MGFLSPIFLWLIPLALLPLVIHLLNKRNITTIQFSTLRFLRLIEKESINKINLLQMILLLLRILIIILIVLMISRPILNTFFLKTTSSTQQIIIMDDSLSMSNKERMILNVCKSIINQIDDNEELTWINMNGGIQFSGIKEDIKNIKDLVKITSLSDSLMNAIKIMENHESNEYSQKEIYLITDRQIKNITQFNEFIKINKNVKGYLIVLPQHEINGTLINARLLHDVIVPNETFDIEVEIKNTGIEKIIDHYVQLIVDNVAVGQQMISIEAEKIKKISFKTTTPRTGFHSGEIHLQNDDMNQDNKYYFNFQVPDNINIGFLGLHDEAAYYFKKSIKALNHKSELFNMTDYLPEKITNELLNNDMIITSPTLLANYEDSELNQYLFNGGHIIAFSDPNTKMEDFNALAESLDEINDDFNKLNLIDLPQSFQELNYENIASHQLNDIFNNSQDRNIRFFSYFNIPYDPLNTMLTLKDGSSVWNRYVIGKGIFDIFAFSMDLKWTNFPIKGSFLPTVHYMLFSNPKYNVIENQTTTEHWSIPINEHLGKNLFHEYPNGVKEILSNFKNGKIKTNQLSMPGLHKISNESKILAQSSVNVNKLELINNLIDIEDIVLNKSNNMSLIEYDDNIIADLHDARTGIELWRPILYLITILVMIEMFISNPIRKT